MKYIGMDAHISSVSFCVIDQDNKILDESTVAVHEKLIKEYVESFKGVKKLTFEEGPMAQWLYNMLHDKVDELIICNPVKNALICKGNSNDKIDSRKLAKLLRLGELSKVVHPDTRERQNFRELMNLYFKIVQDTTRAKNRLKETFRQKGISCAGSKIYNADNKNEWAKKLHKYSMSQESALVYFRQIDFLTTEKEGIYERIKNISKKFKEIKEFLKIPGVGLITASAFSAYIFTPWRFENKLKLWAYCGLSLVENDTGIKIEKEEEEKRKKKIIKRLTHDGNRKLKCVLKSAAECAVFNAKENEFKIKYRKLIERGLRSESALLSVTRSLANKLYGTWKEIEKNNVKKTHKKA